MQPTITIHIPEIERLNQNLEAFLAVFQRQQMPMPEQPNLPEQPAPELPAEEPEAAAPEAPPPSYEVRAVLAQLRREKGAEACKEILRRHGTDALSKLVTSEYAAVIAEAQEAMQ